MAVSSVSHSAPLPISPKIPANQTSKPHRVQPQGQPKKPMAALTKKSSLLYS